MYEVYLLLITSCLSLYVILVVYYIYIFFLFFFLEVAISGRSNIG